MRAEFDRFSIHLTMAQAVEATDSLEGFKAVLGHARVAEQLRRLDPADVTNELLMIRRTWNSERDRLYIGKANPLSQRDRWGPSGEPWSAIALLNHEANLERLLWLSACTIRRSRHPRWRA